MNIHNQDMSTLTTDQGSQAIDCFEFVVNCGCASPAELRSQRDQLPIIPEVTSIAEQNLILVEDTVQLYSNEDIYFTLLRMAKTQG
jgi:hypothetical protein